MTPLEIAAVAALVAVCVYALAVLTRIATAEPEPEREPRHLYVGAPEQIVDAHPVPGWALAHYKPRHLAFGGAA